MQKIVVVNYYDEDEDSLRHLTGSRESRTKEYEYLAPSGAKGTEKFAVVMPGSSGSVKTRPPFGFKIVKITGWKELSEQSFQGDLKRVVDVIDTDEFDAHQELYRKRKALEARIETKVAELSKIQQLRILAESDPDAASLLAIYDALK